MQEFEILFYKKAQPTINTNSWVVHKDEFEKLILAAKEKERNQIRSAYKDCHDLGHIYGLDTEQYYNQTYNQNK